MRFGVELKTIRRGFVLALLLVVCSASLAGAQQIIDRVRVAPSGAETEIDISFTIPLTYISHSPQTRGDTLVIDLRSALGAGGNASGALGNESKRINDNGGVPLSEVRFEGLSATGQQLILEFDRPVDFRVVGASNGGSVTVIVPREVPLGTADLEASPPPPKAETVPLEPETPTAKAAPTAEATLPALSDERLEQTWQEAKQAMTGSDFQRAIQLYTKLLQLPPHTYSQQAQEFLGLARERNDQLAHAKSEYEAYLAAYPEGEASDRVRQRLAGIVTSTVAPKAELRSARSDADEEGESAWADWDFLQFGGISEFYVFRENVSDDIGTEVIQNDFFTDVDYTLRATNDRYDLRALFVGGHTLSFIEDAKRSEFSVSSLDVDFLDQELGLSARVGRQRQNNSGILGRFDGGFFGYQITPKVKINAFAGFPVERRSNPPQTDRYFTGGSVEFQPFSDAWEFTVFGLNQVADGITDRRAIGGSTSYSSNQLFGFSLLDYDILYNDLNLALPCGPHP